MCHHLDHLAAAEWEASETADTEEPAEAPDTEEKEEPPVDPELVVPTPS